MRGPSLAGPNVDVCMHRLCHAALKVILHPADRTLVADAPHQAHFGYSTSLLLVETTRQVLYPRQCCRHSTTANYQNDMVEQSIYRPVDPSVGSVDEGVQAASFAIIAEKPQSEAVVHTNKKG